jgi:hypothetical protein
MSKQHSVINIGLGAFLTALQEKHTPFTHIAWRPPAQGDQELTDILFDLTVRHCDRNGDSRINLANAEAVRRILAGMPVLRRVRPARECIPAMTPTTILHSGPPIPWDEMCAPMRGAILGALQYEGLAASAAEAQALMDSGRIACGPTYPHGAVAPMAGIISPSMPLLEVENEAYGNRAFSPLNEGVGQVLRFGAHGPSVIAHLRWLEASLAPALDKALSALGGVNLKNIMAQALSMGDEMHQRNIAASLLFYRAICCELDQSAASRADALKIMDFLARGNNQFFLNLAMAASRCMIDPARNIPFSSVVTAMSRNGVHFGITVSALGDQWLTSQSQKSRALYFPGYSEADANPDMGDSAIVECCGLGGFAMASAPAVVRFAGAGGIEDAVRLSRDMARICVGRNPDLPLPNLDFAGVPLGIDIRKVVATGILPVINSGVAHRNAGIGQVGAGIVRPPMEVMHKALRTFHGLLSGDEQAPA